MYFVLLEIQSGFPQFTSFTQRFSACDNTGDVASQNGLNTLQGQNKKSKRFFLDCPNYSIHFSCTHKVINLENTCTNTSKYKYMSAGAVFSAAEINKPTPPPVSSGTWQYDGNNGDNTPGLGNTSPVTRPFIKA